MNVLHVVAGLGRKGGGLSEAVAMLATKQAEAGHQVTIATVAAPGVELIDVVKRFESAGGRVVTFAPSWPSAVFFSWGMFRHLRDLVSACDVVHVHSNWTFPVWWTCNLACMCRRGLVMSPHGCLAPERLKRSAFKKKLAGKLFDRRYLRRASAIHVTSEAELASVESFLAWGSAARQGGPVSLFPRMVVLPFGVETVTYQGDKDRGWLDERWPECRGRKAVLSMSRIDSVKGLDLLVSGWARLCECHEGWHLLIAGPDENGYQADLEAMAARAKMNAHVTFCGPLFGSDKTKALRSVDLFVLPTRNDNFGMAVAEALAAGMPVITTKGAPWAELLGNTESSKVRESGTTANNANNANEDDFRTLELSNSITSSGRCGWWIDIGVEPLVRALKEAMDLTDEERRVMGENGRRLVETKYRWETVAEKMAAVYSEIVKCNP